MNEMSEGMKVLLQYAASLGPYNKQEPSLDREDIISMAGNSWLSEYGVKELSFGREVEIDIEALERFASLVVAHVK